jgi:hypothetical protein
MKEMDIISASFFSARCRSIKPTRKNPYRISYTNKKEPLSGLVYFANSMKIIGFFICCPVLKIKERAVLFR